MLRARLALRVSRPSRFLHTANTLLKQRDFDESLIGEYEPVLADQEAKPVEKDDPFKAFLQSARRQSDKTDTVGDSPFPQYPETKFSIQNSRFDKTNRFEYDAMDLELDSLEAPERPEPDGMNFDWDLGLDEWAKPDSFGGQAKDPYVMRQDMDISPLRGSSEEVSNHFVDQPGLSQFSEQSSTFEKIFDKVMSKRGTAEDPRVITGLEQLRSDAGVETPSLNSPYANMFDTEIPEAIVKICAEPDMEDRHAQIEAMDLSECSEREISMVKQLRALIQVDSDFELLQFIDTELAVFEGINAQGAVPFDPPHLATGFPLLLNEALQLLVEKFESPAEAIALFDTVKTRSGDMYFATVSTDVYFTMIKIVWEFYRDLSTLVVIASDITYLNIKSRAIVKTLEEVELASYKLAEARKRRVPEYAGTITARMQHDQLRKFSDQIAELRKGLGMRMRPRVFRVSGEMCTY